MKVLADTSGLFAALVRNDRMHLPAKATMTRLLLEEFDLCTTSYVLLETLALLQARVGLHAADEFERTLRPRFEVIWVGGTLHERAFRRLGLRQTHGCSLVDCCSFVVMEDQGIQQAFGYDKHFSDEGFRLVREASDLD